MTCPSISVSQVSLPHKPIRVCVSVRAFRVNEFVYCVHVDVGGRKGGGGDACSVFFVCFWDDDLNENYNHFACRWPNTFVADRIDTCCDGVWSPRSSLPHDIDSPVACVSIAWRSLCSPRNWWRRNVVRRHDRRTPGTVRPMIGRRRQQRNLLHFLLQQRPRRRLHCCCCYCCHRLSDSDLQLKHK